MFGGPIAPAAGVARPGVALWDLRAVIAGTSSVAGLALCPDGFCKNRLNRSLFIFNLTIREVVESSMLSSR